MQKSPPKQSSPILGKKAKTRQQLIDAAIQLVLTMDYDSIKPEDIADIADIGTRTFYNHFENKQECVIAAVSQRFKCYAQDLETTVHNTIDDDQAAVIATMASQMFQLIATDKVTQRLLPCPIVLGEAIAQSQGEFISANLAKGVAAGRLQPSLDEHTLGPIVTWGFVGLVMASIDKKSQTQDSINWARFILQNLNISAPEIDRLVAKLQN